jgi:hypothetical protein
MALTPSLIVFSRQDVDYLAPIPFVLGWLWCLMRFLETRGLRLAVCAGLLLGVGLLSYISSWVTMPLLLIVTWMVALIVRQPKLLAGSLAGFAGPCAALIAWLAWHPGVFTSIVRRYHNALQPRPS